MKKLFRLHKGGFLESLETTKEVADIDDILNIVRESYSYYSISSVSISINDRLKDDRLPSDWNGIEYPVYAHNSNHIFIAGYSNFV